MSVNEKMTAIASAIRGYTGGADKLSLDKIAAAIPDVFSAGEDAKDAEWQTKFYTAFVRGNDAATLSLSLPFAPDYITIIPFEPCAAVTNYTFWGFFRDFKTFARIGGGEIHRVTSNSAAFNMFNNNTINNFITLDGNTVTFTPPSASAFNGVLWRSECLYAVIAVNYTDGKDDKTLLCEYVQSLPSSGGSVTVSSRRLSETGMSDAEFEAFVKEKQPSWSFVIE